MTTSPENHNENAQNSEQASTPETESKQKTNAHSDQMRDSEAADKKPSDARIELKKVKFEENDAFPNETPHQKEAIDDEAEFEETVAMSPEELGLGRESNEAEFEETVAIPPEELNRKMDSDEQEFEETVAIPPEELNRKMESDEQEFEETVAIPPEELKDKMESNEQEFEETVAIPPEELKDKMASDEQEFEETVAIPPEQLKEMMESDEQEFEETVAIPPEELKDKMASDEQEFEETVAIPPEELKEMTESDEEAFQETVAIPPEELQRMMEEDKETLQETEVIPPDKLKQMMEQDADEFQETVAMTPDELEGKEPDEEAFQETVAIPLQELEKAMGADADAEEGEKDKKKPIAKQTQPQKRIADKDDDMSVIAAMRSKLDKLVSEDAREKDAIPIDQMAQMLEPQADGQTENVFQASPELNVFNATSLEKKYFHENVCKNQKGGKYKLNTKLFAGGMGAILEAEDRFLDRISAMKVVLPEKKSNANTLQQFITEAKITSMLEHPNIIPVHELGLMNAAGLYFTMKLAEGQSLNDILTNLKQNDPEYIKEYNTYYLLNIFRKVCDAVSFAHSRDIIHQDIKPHNVMVGEYGEVLLMDWGLARNLNPDHTDIGASSAARDNRIKGSPTYMSPEQTYGVPEKTSKHSDIFLLGAMLYHIFTLKPPYSGKNMKEIILKARKGDFTPPQERAPDRQIPDEINRIILKAMAFEVEDRYSSVNAMSLDIDDIIAGKWSQQEKRDFEEGDILMTEGEIGEEAYLILKGRVRVVKERADKKIVLGMLQAGDIVGEMSLIRKEKRSASVEAVEFTQVAVLNTEVLARNLKKLPPYMEKIVSTLTDRLSIANDKIHPHLVRDCTYVILKQLRLLYWYKVRATGLKQDVKRDAIVNEVAEDLGLPLERVNIVVDQAAKLNLIKLADQFLTIPDDAKLSEFCQRAKAGL